MTTQITRRHMKASPVAQSRRSVGRPPKPMPEPIPDTPENVARRAIFSGPPKPRENWEYLRSPPQSR